MMNFTSASCPTCQASFDHLPVEFDGEIGYAVLESRPCAECGKALCPCCDQFACDGCGSIFCASHLTSIPDGTPRPLLCCPACAAECLQQDLPFVLCCPQCHSEAVSIREYGFGTSSETGYQDAGKRFECLGCGHTGERDELEEVAEQPARIEPGRAALPAAALPKSA